jgi:hypothetical protein
MRKRLARSICHTDSGLKKEEFSQAIYIDAADFTLNESPGSLRFNIPPAKANRSW